MSLFSWFRRKPTPPKAVAAPQHAAGLLQGDATVPLGTATRAPAAMAAAQAAEAAGAPRNERMERRELLYGVVRDAMVRASVLTAGYKFKVLSLDQRGRQFLVMIDLAREYGGDTTRLSEMEALIAQTAKGRHDILVTAVYWRIHEHVAVGVPQKPPATDSNVPPRPSPGAMRAQRDRAGPASAPAPLGMAAGSAAQNAQRAAAAPQSAAAAVATVPPAGLRSVPPGAAAPTAASASSRAPLLHPRTAAPFEPIEADEVAAFKRALAAAPAASSTAAAQPGVAVRTGPLLPLPEATGFEDTEMPESGHRSPDLSSTQYGELR